MTAEHTCQPPQHDPPPAGRRWECPKCGRWWRLENVRDGYDFYPDGGGQAVQRGNWVSEDDPS